MGYSMPADKGLRGDVNLRTGHAPTRAGQVAIDATIADKHHIPLGANIKILFHGPTQEFTVVGTVDFGGEKDLGGTTSAYFDLPQRSGFWAPRATSTGSTLAPSRRRQPGHAHAAAQQRRSRRRGGAHRRRRHQGVLRRREEGPQVRGHPVLDLRRHRAVRRIVHHLEHLHDDRHPALTRDRAAAGDRFHPGAGDAQPAARGSRCSGSALRPSASGSESASPRG